MKPKSSADLRAEKGQACCLFLVGALLLPIVGGLEVMRSPTLTGVRMQVMMLFMKDESSTTRPQRRSLREIGRERREKRAE